MYKYIKIYPKEIFERVKENSLKYTTVDSFLNKQLRQQKNNYRKLLQKCSVNDIIKYEGEEFAYKKLIYLEEDEIDIEALEKYLKKLLKDKTTKFLNNNPELKRLIRIYDLVKYRLK